jgi:hypothetical protein
MYQSAERSEAPYARGITEAGIRWPFSGNQRHAISRRYPSAPPRQAAEVRVLISAENIAAAGEASGKSDSPAQGIQQITQMFEERVPFLLNFSLLLRVIQSCR